MSQSVVSKVIKRMLIVKALRVKVSFWRALEDGQQ